GVFRGRVERIRALRVPHMGWNALRLRSTSPLLAGLEGADVYFAHSYACVPTEPVAAADVEHGGVVVAAVERGAIAGVQFHPEPGGRAGARVLANALAWSNGG